MNARIGIMLLLALAVWLVPQLVHAEGISAIVQADETQMRVGDTITVDFAVAKSSGRGSLPTPALPESVREAFDVGQCAEGESDFVQVFGGRRAVTMQKQMSCPLTARKAGAFKIAFTVPEGKKTVASNTITIEVLESDAERAPLEDPTVEQPVDASEDVFLWVSTDKTRAYVGEQVTFRLDVYEAKRFLDVSLQTSPTFEGFGSKELPLPDVYVTSVAGRRYRVRPGIRRALFAQRSGTATIGESELLVGRRKRRYSSPIEIDVLPLPAEGQPPNFAASNVGRYAINASVDRDTVQPGEPFTLTYVISGEGNIELIDPGDWPTLPSVRSYDPKITTERSRGLVVGGRRTYAFLMIPERPGTLTIPAHELHYFDPAAESYATATTAPLTVVVGGDPNAVVATEDDSPPVQSTVDDPLAPVVSIDALPRGNPRVRLLDHERWSAAMVALPLLIGLSLGGGWVWRRFGPDDVARARARVRARRRERIELAQATVDSGDGFHAAVAALLQDVALEVAGPQGTGLPRPELLRLLERRGVEAEERRKLERLLDQCDAARFGAGGGESDERQMLLDDALALVRNLAKGAA